MSNPSDLDHAEHQDYEADWWGDCTNTFSEEAKQITYAYHMGLVNVPDGYTGRWPSYDLGGRSVVDLGGGPTSLLLKTTNTGPCAVVDPCDYPQWVGRRYATKGVAYFREPAETWRSAQRFDECWIYNVLQHVEDPEAVIATARLHASTLRIFEWINTPPSLGHPHTLTVELLDEWIGGQGEWQFFDGSSNGVYGQAYYGAFAL